MAKLNPRTFRRDRYLYSSASGSGVILLHSHMPGQWVVADYPTGYVFRTNSRRLARDYDNIAYSTPASVYNDAAFMKALGQNVAQWLTAYPVIGALGVIRRLHVQGLITSQGTTAVSGGNVATTTVLESGEDVIDLASELAQQLQGVGRAKAKGFNTPTLNPKPYWYESKEDEALYRDFISLRRGGHTVNLLIAGPSGAGKTVGVQRLGEDLGIPVHVVNCQAITTPEKWIGQMMADINTGTHFEPSQHIQWVERTHQDCQGADECIILYDEITRLRPELNNMTYSLFDTQRGLEVPQMGRRILMHDKNIIVATANIGAAFSGTHVQDRAFRERFAITMERTFPPKDEEVKILESATGIDKASATQIVNVADASRNLWRNSEIDSPISTRTLVAWSLLVAGNYSIKKAAEYTVLPMYSDEGNAASDRAKITSLIEGKTSP